MSRLIVIEESQTIQRMVEIALKGLSLDITPIRYLEELSSGMSPELFICSSQGSWGDEAALLSQLTVRGMTAPIIMLTPHGRPPEGYLGGLVTFAITKPFHTQTLVRAVCQALERETPDEAIFVSKNTIPLKRGGHSTQNEPVMPASMRPPRSTEPPSAKRTATSVAPQNLITPPQTPPQPMTFQTIIGVPIPDQLPPEENPYEASTSFGFVPEPQAVPLLHTMKGGSYQSMMEANHAQAIPDAFEASTSFGFSPESLEAYKAVPPPVYDEPPPVFVSSEDEIEDLDDSFSALDQAELDANSDWEEEVEETEQNDHEASLNLERFTQSSSPLLNGIVDQVMHTVIDHLKQAGIEQATHEDALQLFSEVAWEMIPEIAEQVVRQEITRLLDEEAR